MDLRKPEFRIFGVSVLLFCAIAVTTAGFAELNDRLGPQLDHPAIQYRLGTLTDPVSILERRLQRTLRVIAFGRATAMQPINPSVAKLPHFVSLFRFNTQ